MVGDGSAFAALGLEPDADPAEIDRAYRRLIKQHHPDREGGDAGRAAEINRAYRDLRGDRNLKDPLELHDEWSAPARSDRVWLLLAILLTACALVFLIRSPMIAPESQVGRTRIGASKLAGDSDVMDQPLHVAAIEQAARHAQQVSRTRDEMTLARTSTDCHRSLRSNPSLLQFDRCAAFDDAVVQLENRDPLRDQGPFAEIAVTGRLWSGASALSQDSLAIDARLDRIRRQVEVALAPSGQPLSAAPSQPPQRSPTPAE